MLDELNNLNRQNNFIQCTDKKNISFCIWYLDDGTFGGKLHDFLYDLDTVRRLGPTNGLLLNEIKCVIITTDDNVVRSIQACMQNILHIPCNVVVLLVESAINTLLHS